MERATDRIALLFDKGEYGEICKLCPQDSTEGDLISTLYALAARYLNTLPVTCEGLLETWQCIKSLMQQESSEPLSLAATVQEVVARCTTALYRTCNDRLKLEYAVLQGEVSFEKKEYVIDRMRELLLGADVDFGAILRVLDEAGAQLLRTEDIENAPEAFFLGTLRLLQNAAQISEDNCLLEQYPHIRIARRACRLPIRPEMADALAKRRELLKFTLQGDEVLDDWDFFAAYAQEAGISREALFKAQKKRRRIERLKFWKKRPTQPQY